MKKLVLSSIALFTSFAVQAKTVSSSHEVISPANIDTVIHLVDKDQIGILHKKLSIVVEDHGMSTDASPRYKVYLGYASLAEMGNITASFKVNDQAFKFLSASRKSAGIYEVKVIEFREDGMYEVTQEVDATKMFSDEQKTRMACGRDFCDEVIETSVSVKETAKKIKKLK